MATKKFKDAVKEDTRYAWHDDTKYFYPIKYVDRTAKNKIEYKYKIKSI